MKEEVHTDTLAPSSVSESPTPTFPPTSPSRRRLFHIFIVDQNIGYLNLFSYLFACLFTVSFVAFLSLLQPFVLTLILNITENTGNVTGSLALYDEIIALPATLLWGVLSDRIGRRPVYSLGFIFLGITLNLYPFVQNVYPHMLLARLLFSIGSSACTCMMTGTLGDIAGAQHERGRVSALVGLFSGCGGLLAGLALVKLPWQLESLVHSEIKGLQLTFTIVGCVSLLLAVVTFFTMPKVGAGSAEGLTKWVQTKFTHKDSAKKSEMGSSTAAPAESLEESTHPWYILKYGFLAGRDPRISLAYVSSFVSRADTVLFTSFISLWVIQHFIDQGSCKIGDDSTTSCKAASRDTHTLTGYGQGIGLVFAPIFGYATERFQKSTVLAVAGFMGAIGSIPFAFTTKAPADKSNMAFVTFAGIGQMGMIVTGMTLVNGPHVDPRFRGSIAGVFSFCGAISIMAMARLGGYLFDVWMHGAPFVLMGIAHLIVAVLSVYVRIITPRLERQDQERLEAAERERENKLERDQL